jgi:hypothetical protein
VKTNLSTWTRLPSTKAYNRRQSLIFTLPWCSSFFFSSRRRQNKWQEQLFPPQCSAFPFSLHGDTHSRAVTDGLDWAASAAGTTARVEGTRAAVCWGVGFTPNGWYACNFDLTSPSWSQTISHSLSTAQHSQPADCWNCKAAGIGARNMPRIYGVWNG